MTHPAFWVMLDHRVVFPLVDRADSAATRMAGVRQPCRSERLRALGGARRCRPKRSGIALRTARTPEKSAHIHGATARRRTPRQLRFSIVGAARVDAHRDGDSAFGVRGLLGNGWEWTSTPFAPFAGFKPFGFYPGYSADFFDGTPFRAEGRLLADGGADAAALVPQLVSAALSLRLCRLPLRGESR